MLTRMTIALLTTTILVVGSQTPSNSIPVSATIPSPNSAPTKATQGKGTVQGSFVGTGYSTRGIVKLVTTNGRRYLEFNDSFGTDAGPDLLVLLHREASPQSYRTEDYLNLGELQAVAGTQRYLLPEDTELTDFGSVVIWCRQFNTTFGYAPL